MTLEVLYVNRVKKALTEEGLHLVKTAKIIHRDMKEKTWEFKAEFEKGCQEMSLPRSLIVLLNMIMYGKTSETSLQSKAVLSIAQLVRFNSTRQGTTTTQAYHQRQYETPLPIYLGLSIHARTRKRSIIDKMFELGLCVSYDRVLYLLNTLSDTICKQYTTDGVVCPPKMRLNLFTSAAGDNIDHNPSSTTSKDSYHGTAISLFQQPTVDNTGEARE